VTAGKMLKTAQECLRGDIAGSMDYAMNKLEELEPYEREPFLLLFENLLRHQIDAVIERHLSLISKEFRLFRSKKKVIPRETLSDRIEAWMT